MKNLLKVLLILSTLFSCINSYAENAGSRVFVLFINGVNANRSDAEVNLAKIEENINIKSNMLVTDILYNETHGLLTKDLWDVFVQKQQEHSDLTIDDFIKIYMKTNNLNYAVDSEEYKALGKEIADLYRKEGIFGGINFDSILKQFHQIVKDYANSYVLLISHSQGNLYANQLYDYLVSAENFPKQHIALFGVASPAKKIMGEVYPAKYTDQTRYFTADNDYVINSLRVLSSASTDSNQPMPANKHLSLCNDFLCHGLVEAYLSDSDMRLSITKKISHFLVSLKRNLILGGKNKNIRLLFSTIHDSKSGHSCHGELVNKSNGQVVCTILFQGDDTPGGSDIAECEENIMSYLEMPNAERIDHVKNTFIGFTDKLKPGAYVFLADLKDDHYLTIHLLGNISSSHSYNVSFSNSCDYADLVEDNVYRIPDSSETLGAGLFSATLQANYSDYGCVKKFPYLLYNNKLLAGEFNLF